MSLLNILVLL